MHAGVHDVHTSHSLRPPSRQKPPPMSLVLEQPAAEASAQRAASSIRQIKGMPASDLAVVISESDSDAEF